MATKEKIRKRGAVNIRGEKGWGLEAGLSNKRKKKTQAGL